MALDENGISINIMNFTLETNHAFVMHVGNDSLRTSNSRYSDELVLL